MDLSFRGAVWEDAEFLLSLRNDPSVWPHCIQARPVVRREHLEWFKDVLQRDDVKIFILLQDRISIGQVRYDLKQEGAYVSISLCVDHQGQGFGVQALKLTGQKIFSLPNVTALKALIKENNKGSLRCFENAGFCRLGRERNGNEYFMVMELRKAS